MLFNLIGFFGGFLTSSIIDTSLGEFGEWAIVGSSIIITSIESFNSFYYLFKRNQTFKRFFKIRELFKLINFFKAGFIYGLIVDAFKLGS